MSNKFKRFMRKTQLFFKTNSLALIVCLTTILTLTIIGLAAFYSLNGEEEIVTTPVDNIIEEPSLPTSTTEPIVFLSPLENINITKNYAEDYLLEDSTTGVWQTHQGIDFAAADGDAVLAVYSGTIESVVNDIMEGLVVTLKVSDNIKVVYKSLSSDALVSEGDQVKAGQQIGTVATNVTEKAEGVHLHLEVWQDKKLVDPNLYFSFTDK